MCCQFDFWRIAPERITISAAPHPEKQHITMCMILNHPLSRGTIVTITSVQCVFLLTWIDTARR